MKKFIFFIFLLFIVIFSCKSSKDKVESSTPKPEAKLDTCQAPIVSDQLVESSREPASVEEEEIASSEPRPSKNEVLNRKPKVNKLEKESNTNLDANSININKGLLAYSVPLEMKVGEEYTVKVRITKQKDRTVLIVGDNQIPISDDTTNVRVESIRVSSVMSASLYGKKGDFEIESTSRISKY
jgi:hypothetical protein